MKNELWQRGACGLQSLSFFNILDNILFEKVISTVVSATINTKLTIKLIIFKRDLPLN